LDRNGRQNGTKSSFHATGGRSYQAENRIARFDLILAGNAHKLC